MFFRQTDRVALNEIMDNLIQDSRLLLKINKNMPTRTELDQALAQNKQDVEDAIERWQNQLKAANDAHAKALSDLQAKIDAEEDFSAELQTLNETHNRVQQLASMPVANVISPPPSAIGTNTGAAGATVGGAEAHDAAVAAGGEPVEDQGDHPGSIPTPHNPNAGEEEEESQPGVKSEPEPTS